MKVFISWSGERSQILAQKLYEWVPMVLQSVTPWLSQADIAAGDRWLALLGSSASRATAAYGSQADQ
jgi:hypothetical protein